MEGNIKDLSNYRLDKAEKNLKIAKKLYKDKAYGVALNRRVLSAELQ